GAGSRSAPALVRPAVRPLRRRFAGARIRLVDVGGDRLRAGGRGAPCRACGDQGVATYARSMLLYNSPVSGNCYKVRLLFAHLGIEYEREDVDVVARPGRPELLGGLNPALRVPTVVLDDGRPLAESGAILWYFAEGTRFVPVDPYERAQVLQWLFFEQYDHE